jgi:CarD family transcriptional regulator
MVVHPRHGVGTVRGTKTRTGRDGPADYVELFFAAKDLTIMVPVASLDEVGIRDLSTNAEAAAILAILEEPSEVSTAWSERSAATTARMKSSELAQATMVIRDLTRHAARLTKPLSAAESNALQQCLDMVSLELSLVLGLSQSDTRELILNKVGSNADTASSG